MWSLDVTSTRLCVWACVLDCVCTPSISTCRPPVGLHRKAAGGGAVLSVFRAFPTSLASSHLTGCRGPDTAGPSLCLLLARHLIFHTLFRRLPRFVGAAVSTNPRTHTHTQNTHTNTNTNTHTHIHSIARTHVHTRDTHIHTHPHCRCPWCARVARLLRSFSTQGCWTRCRICSKTPPAQPQRGRATCWWRLAPTACLKQRAALSWLQQRRRP